jgi:hypothetical protein
MERKKKELQANISCSVIPSARTHALTLLVSYKSNTLANFFLIFKYSSVHALKKANPLCLSISRHFLLFAYSPSTSTPPPTLSPARQDKF